MGHNKCNRKCPSTSLFSVLEVEETYGHLISPEPKYSYNVPWTGHTIPQLNSTMETLEYIWKKWRLKQASPWWTTCWPAWLNGQVYKPSVENTTLWRALCWPTWLKWPGYNWNVEKHKSMTDICWPRAYIAQSYQWSVETHTPMTDTLLTYMA